MDISGLVFLVLFVAGVGLIGAGFVGYRRSSGTPAKVASMGAMTSGVALLVFLTLIVPVTRTTTPGESPAPRESAQLSD